jgi:hypothetical protein
MTAAADTKKATFDKALARRTALLPLSPEHVAALLDVTRRWVDRHLIPSMRGSGSQGRVWFEWADVQRQLRGHACGKNGSGTRLLQAKSSRSSSAEKTAGSSTAEPEEAVASARPLAEEIEEKLRASPAPASTRRGGGRPSLTLHRSRE